MWGRWPGDIDCRGNGGEGSLAARIATLARCAICTAEAMAEHFDVLIVGAGISGIGGGYHLTHQCPGTSFVILEAQESFGGTWLHASLSRASAPTPTSTPSATASSPGAAHRSRRPAEIHKYMGEVIEENDLARHIRYRHRIISARAGRARTAAGPSKRRADRHRRSGPLHRQLPVDVPGLLPACARATRRSGRAWSCFEGRSSIRRPGPRTWTTAARTSLVIGSGATAATLVPAMAERLRARHDAAALAHLLSAPAATRSRSPTSCAS